MTHNDSFVQSINQIKSNLLFVINVYKVLNIIVRYKTCSNYTKYLPTFILKNNDSLQFLNDNIKQNKCNVVYSRVRVAGLTLKTSCSRISVRLCRDLIFILGTFRVILN